MADGLTYSSESLRLSNREKVHDDCILFLSMSMVTKSDDEQAAEANGGQTIMAQYDHLHFSHSGTMGSWDTASRQLYNLLKICAQCTVGALQKSTDLTSHKTFSLTTMDFMEPNIGCIVHTMRLVVVS